MIDCTPKGLRAAAADAMKRSGPRKSEALNFAVGVITAAATEIEKLESQLREPTNLIERLGKDLVSARTEIERMRGEQLALSNAYLRLRALIPGAFDTPHAPSPEQVWDTTENALEMALSSTNGTENSRG